MNCHSLWELTGWAHLDDGRRVYFVLPKAPFGSMSKKIVILPTQCVSLPDYWDDVTAAAIANPGMSSWAAFKERAKLAAGEMVLVTAQQARRAVWPFKSRNIWARARLWRQEKYGGS